MIKNVLNLLVQDRNLIKVNDDSKLELIGDNNDYRIHFDIDEPKIAMFAVFKKGLKQQAVLLDVNSKVNIPLWCLKEGWFDVGLISDGYATTSISIPVKGSIIDESGQPAEDSPPGLVEQILNLINEMKERGVEEEKVKQIIEEYMANHKTTPDIGLSVVDGLLCVEMRGDENNVE